MNDIRSTARFTVSSLLAALPTPPRQMTGTPLSANDPLYSLCSDSRLAVHGSLFVCIRGAKNDGHDYLVAAYHAGCRAFLVETPPATPLPPDAAVFVSDNTHRDLSLLACAFYGHPARHMTLVGITGTKGKTTVAQLCRHILAGAGLSVGYIGTSGVQYGNVHKATANTTPGPIELQQYLYEMYQSGVKVVVMEVSSQALWQHRVDGIPFAICALTNLYPDHIGAPEHPTFDHYVACKGRLLREFGARVTLVNADDPRCRNLLQGAQGAPWLCGFSTDATFGAANVEAAVTARGLPMTEFDCMHRQEQTAVRVSLALPGQPNIQNALFAIAVAYALGISVSDAAMLLTDATVPGRFEMIPVRSALTVVDYAHNGAALRAALGALRPVCRGRLHCLFGSVGGRSQCRRSELGAAAAELADFTYLTADNPDGEHVEDICAEIAASFPPTRRDFYTVIPDRTEAIRRALDDLHEGDILLIAGKGDETTQRIHGKNMPHSDRAVVEEYLSAIQTPV